MILCYKPSVILQHITLNPTPLLKTHKGHHFNSNQFTLSIKQMVYKLTTQQEVLGRTNNPPAFLLYMGHTANMSSNLSIAACVFIATERCLPSHCLATIGGIHIQTHRQQSDIISLLFSLLSLFWKKKGRDHLAVSLCISPPQSQNGRAKRDDHYRTI
jgi:hypothetical protein